MGRGVALAAAIAVSLLAVSGAGGSPAQGPKRGGTVTIGVPAVHEPPCFNPLILLCYGTGFGIFDISADLVFARPFTPLPNGTYRGHLVTSVDRRKKPFTLTFHIHPKARWSDGRPVTARDWDYAHRVGVVADAQRRSGYCPAAAVCSARPSVIDAKTFRLRFSRPASLREWKDIASSGGVSPRHVLSLLDDSGPGPWQDTIVNPRTGRPIGSGPFLMQGRKRGHSITLVRNPTYWGKHPAYLDRLVFRFLPVDELADALRSGEIDLILGGPLSANAVREIQRNPSPGTATRTLPGNAWEQLSFRVGPGGHPALKDPRVRRALAYALDRAQLARMAAQEFGRTEPPLAPLEIVVHPSQSPYYQSNWKRYSYQPQLAGRLLARAGCRLRDDDIRWCDGVRLSLRIGARGGNERRERMAVAIVRQLRAVGVATELSFYPNAPGFELRDGLLDIGLWGWRAPGLPDGVFNSGGHNNYMGFRSRLVDRELDNANRVLDERSRAAALNRADKLLSRAVPAIPLYQTPAQIAYRTRLRPAPVPPAPLWNAVNWWVEE